MDNTSKDKVDILNSLVGIAADNNMTVDEMKAERLKRQDCLSKENSYERRTEESD